MELRNEKSCGYRGWAVGPCTASSASRRKGPTQELRAEAAAPAAPAATSWGSAGAFYGLRLAHRRAGEVTLANNTKTKVHANASSGSVASHGDETTRIGYASRLPEDPGHTNSAEGEDGHVAQKHAHARSA